MPDVTRILHLVIYLDRDVSAENAYALSSILIGIAVLSLVVAGLPMLFTRPAPQRAHVLDDMDIDKLRALTRPVGDSPEIAVTSNGDRKSTRLNSSHVAISYAVFCLNNK